MIEAYDLLRTYAPHQRKRRYRCGKVGNAIDYPAYEGGNPFVHAVSCVNADLPICFHRQALEDRDEGESNQDGQSVCHIRMDHMFEPCLAGVSDKSIVEAMQR